MRMFCCGSAALARRHKSGLWLTTVHLRCVCHENVQSHIYERCLQAHACHTIWNNICNLEHAARPAKGSVFTGASVCLNLLDFVAGVKPHNDALCTMPQLLQGAL